MLFRRGAAIVQAVRLDGSEASWRAALRLPGVSRGPAGLLIATDLGHTAARLGDVITACAATGALHLFAADRFDAAHEPI